MTGAPATHAIRVLVADDDAFIRDILVDVLSTEPDFEIVGSAVDAESAIERARETQPDIAVVDVKMPGGGGPAATAGILDASHRTRVVAFSIHDDPASVKEMVRAGAIGYVIKGGSLDEVLLAIREADKNRGYLPPAIAIDVVRELAGLLQRSKEQEDKEAEVAERIERALEKGAIVPVYQAIVDIAAWRVAGVEALARFQLEPRQTPDIWFREAGEVHRRIELELAAIRAEAVAFEDPALGRRCYVSLNAEPETILDRKGRLYEALEGLEWDRVVLEVTENAKVEDYGALGTALRPFRDRGGRLAVDDAGSGYASLQHVLQLEPDIIKLDVALIRDVDVKRDKRAVARALTAAAAEVGIKVVAEGVETRSELEVLRQMGVQYGQGYFMRKPTTLAEATAPLAPLAPLEPDPGH